MIIEHTLLPYPTQTPASSPPKVVVGLTQKGLGLHFHIEQPQGLRLPAPDLQGSADKLWQHTCFECFVGQSGAAAYDEFNLAPSVPHGQWAHYRFSDVRQRQALDTPVHLAPQTLLDASGLHLRVWLPWSVLPKQAPAWDIGLSCVTESIDGHITHWAIRHDCAQADFHHRASWLRIAPAWTTPLETP
jgi:hypothetical protein